MHEKLVMTNSHEVTAVLFGNCDENAKRIEETFGVRLANRGGSEEGDVIIISSPDKRSAERAASMLEYLKRMIGEGEQLDDQTVDYVMGMIADDRESELGTLDDSVICITTKGKPIKAKTVGQQRYVDAIRKNTVILGIGPAGTGKTFLAVAMAVDALRNKQVNRIILTRPAVEAGEKLGSLPGDLQNKIDPYLRPLHDALYEMLGAENYAKYLERNTIEIAPLAYMRGRTLDDSFIILDEAQNTTSEQMKMFLTRLGYNSKAVVTGDPSQTDLPMGKKSGLAVAANILKSIDGIAVHKFTERDVVRHRLVQKIILAYERYDKENPRSSGRQRSFYARTGRNED